MKDFAATAPSKPAAQPANLTTPTITSNVPKAENAVSTFNVEESNTALQTLGVTDLSSTISSHIYDNQYISNMRRLYGPLDPNATVLSKFDGATTVTINDVPNAIQNDAQGFQARIKKEVGDLLTASRGKNDSETGTDAIINAFNSKYGDFLTASVCIDPFDKKGTRPSVTITHNETQQLAGYFPHGTTVEQVMEQSSQMYDGLLSA